VTPSRCLVALLVTLLAAFAGPALGQPQAEVPRGVELPLQVRMSVRVLNITRILETTGEIGASVEYIQRWTDPEQRFDRVAQGKEHLDFVGPDAEARLAKMWSPGVVIENMIGGVRAQTVALSVQEDGSVTLIRRIDADFRAGINMSGFPFDVQRLPIRFVLPRYPAHEVVLTTTEADRAMSSIAAGISLSNWRTRSIEFRQGSFSGWSAQPFSRLTATAVVARISSRYLLRMFVPFSALMSISIFILWAPPSLLGRPQRPTLVFSSLLALSALSFTFEASFPGSISMNSPIAAMISMGYLYLPLVLTVDLYLGNESGRLRAKYPFLTQEIARNTRVTVPLLFAGLCLASLIASGDTG
jgi:hypothetical protein